jgi:hypothetical protein
MYRVGNEKLTCRELVVPAAAGAVLKEATMAAINKDGYAVSASAAEGLTVAGCVLELADNTSGGAGAVAARIRRGTFVWNNDGSIKETDILKDAYVKDAETVTITADGSSIAGKIVAVDEDGVTVEMA